MHAPFVSVYIDCVYIVSTLCVASFPGHSQIYSVGVQSRRTIPLSFLPSTPFHFPSLPLPLLSLTFCPPSPGGGTGLWRPRGGHSRQGRDRTHCAYSAHMCDRAGKWDTGVHLLWSHCHPTVHGSERDDLYPETESERKREGGKGREINSLTIYSRKTPKASLIWMIPAMAAWVWLCLWLDWGSPYKYKWIDLEAL